MEHCAQAETGGVGINSQPCETQSDLAESCRFSVEGSSEGLGKMGGMAMLMSNRAFLKSDRIAFGTWSMAGKILGLAALLSPEARA